MIKTIALCGVSTEIACLLERHGEYRLLCFDDDSERRGDVKLAYFLRDGSTVNLTIVGYPGAAGLVACYYLRTQSSSLSILWVCNREEFRSEAMRLGVNFYGTGPPAIEQVVSNILKSDKIKGS